MPSAWHLEQGHSLSHLRLAFAHALQALCKLGEPLSPVRPMLVILRPVSYGYHLGERGEFVIIYSFKSSSSLLKEYFEASAESILEEARVNSLVGVGSFLEGLTTCLLI
jgi:hypothetical protein